MQPASVYKQKSEQNNHDRSHGVTSAVADSIEPLFELRCQCVKTLSGVHPSKIASLEVIKAGAHCSKVQVM